jgi:hypothetical protein
MWIFILRKQNKVGLIKTSAIKLIFNGKDFGRGELAQTILKELTRKSFAKIQTTKKTPKAVSIHFMKNSWSLNYSLTLSIVSKRIKKSKLRTYFPKP